MDIMTFFFVLKECFRHTSAMCYIWHEGRWGMAKCMLNYTERWWALRKKKSINKLFFYSKGQNALPALLICLYTEPNRTMSAEYIVCRISLLHTVTCAYSGGLHNMMATARTWNRHGICDLHPICNSLWGKGPGRWWATCQRFGKPVAGL